MTGRISIDEFLPIAACRQATFLTLTLAILLTATFTHADSLPSAAEIEANKERASEAMAYVRHEAFQGMSILPGEAREALSWFSGSWHPMQMAGDDEETIPAVGGAVPAQSQALRDASSSESWVPDLASNFHHKGFLPTHDAMVLGLGMQHSLFDNKLGLTGRPFYGQSWHSLHSYYGGEVAMDIDKRDDGMPWGKIALGYIQGNDSMIDHGTGVELHGDVDLTRGFKFTSGIRQNSADGNSNYMLLRWKLDFQ